jgi:hypothetical protein
MVTGVSIAAAVLGALCVVASATALSRVDPQEAGAISGIVSTFREFGASAGAAAVSSAAAASVTAHTGTATAAGFDSAFLLATTIAATSAVIALRLIPTQEA